MHELFKLAPRGTMHKDSWKRALVRLIAEPLVHFFTVGALLFFAQSIWVEDEQTIAVTPGLRADLARLFHDRMGREPLPAELQMELTTWKRDEALFREALRKGLDRDDAGVRSLLVAKMQSSAEFEIPEVQPTEQELKVWFDSHRERYETPHRYDFEWLSFPKAEPDVQEQLDRFKKAINDGAPPSGLGRPLLGAKLTLDQMKGRLAPELVASLPTQAVGQWQTIESSDALLLSQVKKVEGGLPSLEEVRSQLVYDWTTSIKKEALDQKLDVIVRRYHFESHPLSAGSFFHSRSLFYWPWVWSLALRLIPSILLRSP
jgi:hypothetical protein